MEHHSERHSLAAELPPDQGTISSSRSGNALRSLGPRYSRTRQSIGHEKQTCAWCPSCQRCSTQKHLHSNRPELRHRSRLPVELGCPLRHLLCNPSRVPSLTQYTSATGTCSIILTYYQLRNPFSQVREPQKISLVMAFSFETTQQNSRRAGNSGHALCPCAVRGRQVDRRSRARHWPRKRSQDGLGRDLARRTLASASGMEPCAGGASILLYSPKLVLLAAAPKKRP